ncbi:MAG: PAS domain S-box protein [Desulfobacterales bacterium]|nr:PAS domain S-box protein [Desulfobacterales bacterium]
MSIRSLFKYIKITLSAAVLSLSLLCLNLYAGETDIFFEHPAKVEFLLYDFIQDRDGFFWLASFGGGLMRYDGYDLKAYKKGLCSISSNSVISLYEDKEGLLWICTTDSGLNKYDKETGRFTVYHHKPGDLHSLSSNRLTTAFEDKDGILWIGTIDNGLNKFNKKTNHVTVYRYNPNNPNSLSDDHVSSVYEDKSGNLWVGTRKGGLNRFNRKAGTFAHYKHDPADPASLSNNHVSKIIEDKSGILWIGTANRGLNKFDKETGSFTVYRHDPHNPDSLGSDSVTEICEDKSGTLWIGTFAGGLNKFNRKTKTFTRYIKAPGNNASLSSNDISAVYQDNSGILWVACLSGEIEKYNINSGKFELYQNDPGNPASLSDNITVPIYEDRNGVVWIGTGRGGLNKFDRKTETFTHYKPDPYDPGSIKDTFVSTIFEDSSGVFWVGTSSLSDATLSIFDRKTGKCIRHFRNDPENPRSMTQGFAVRKIIEDRDDHNILWIAIDRGGFEKFNREKQTFTHYKHDPDNPDSLSYNKIWHMYQDKTGLIWMATEGGLDKFDKHTEIFTHHKHNPDDPSSISSDTVTSVYEDTSGRMWVCTADGLNKFDRDTGTFKRYTTDDGFPDNTFFGILEDSKGNYWVSTNNGLAKFRQGDKTVRVYTKSDGLQGNAFFYTSFCKTSDNEMWFGGFNGVNRFHPENIEDNPHIPPIVLTSLKQGGIELDLAKAPEKIRFFELDWRHNYFEFEFAGLEYSDPLKNQYKYMLEGADRGWFNSGTRRFGRYTGLNSGTYTLRIKGSNNDGVWNEKGISVEISVIPPFWETHGFYLILTMSVITVILCVIFYIARLNIEIKERRQAEKSLRESESRLQAILDNTTAVIYLKDIRGRFILVNRQFEKIFHLTKQEIAGKTDYDLVPKDLADTYRANDLKILETGMPVQFEESAPLEDGIHTVISVKFPMFSEDGIPYGVCGISTDITERKQAEDELRHLRNYLHNIINSMPSLLMGVDSDGRVTQWNLEAEKKTGIKAAEAQGLMLADVFPQLAVKTEEVQQAVRDCKPYRKKKVATESNGETRYSDITVYPLIANGAEGAVIRIDDVTRQVRIEEMMIQTEKMMSVGGLAAGMAHEINNPLAGILQSTQNILRRISPELPKNIKTARECGIDLKAIHIYLEQREILKFLEGIKESGERAADIVNNMLQFSRFSETSMRPVNLAQLIDKTIELASHDYDMKKKYDFRHIEIIRDYDPGLPEVYCAATETEQVILNLLRNAAQAMAGNKEERKKPLIILRVKQENNMARIEVEDNGPGMDEKVRKRIFEPFFTTKDVGIGTGLGLSVSYFIITNNHKGTMSVKSSCGRGTKIIINLPINKKPD